MNDNRDNIVNNIYEILASSIPDGATRGDALRAALKFAADCIHQVEPDSDETLRISQKLLESYFHIFQEKFGTEVMTEEPVKKKKKI